MARLAKPLREKSRKQLKGMDVIPISDVAKLVARRSGITSEQARKCLSVLGEIIIELVMQGYCVTIFNLGSFFLRKLSMPSYSIKEKRGTGYKTRWSLTFKKPYSVSKDINLQMAEMHPEELEENNE